MIWSEVFVYTMSRAGKAGAWSRYLFSFVITDFAQLGNDLYARHGDSISRVSESATTDGGEPFPGLVWWPYLDIGTPGITKMIESIDYVGNGSPASLSIGTDQRYPDAFTAPMVIGSDTMPGTPIPLPVAAPTYSVKLEFNSAGGKWQVQSVVLTTHPFGGQP